MELAISLLTIILLTLATLSCVFGSIWLMIVGGCWWAIGYGILALFLAPYSLIIISFPARLLINPTMAFIDNGKKILAFALFMLGRIYEWAVITAWCFAVFLVFIPKITDTYYINGYWALFVWGYGVALSAWLYMTKLKRKKYAGDYASTILIFSTQIAYLVLAGVVFFTNIYPLKLAAIFGGITLAGGIIGSLIDFSALLKTSQNN